jgi:hypothetical protein
MEGDRPSLATGDTLSDALFGVTRSRASEIQKGLETARARALAVCARVPADRVVC